MHVTIVKDPVLKSQCVMVIDYMVTSAKSKQNVAAFGGFPAFCTFQQPTELTNALFANDKVGMVKLIMVRYHVTLPL